MSISFVLLHVCVHTLICCEPVLVVQCREEAMPFSCVLRVAILLLLSTLPQKWRATSLTLMMMDTQLCTGQPKRASCPWWSTSWDPVDLIWKQGTRLTQMIYLCIQYIVCMYACILCCLSDAFVTSLGTPAAWTQWWLTLVELCKLCTYVPVDVVHY